MNLNQLFYFRKLAELQNYTQAAAELYISQPSLSYSIMTLEKELGSSLFQKKGRYIVLTNQGKEFYKCVLDVLARLDDGVTTLRQNMDMGKINIATIPALTGSFVPKNIRRYISSHPNTTFDIFACKSSIEVIAGIKDGIYDIGFSYELANEKDFNFVPMLNQEFVVVTKSDHELSKKKVLCLSDLQGYPLITYRETNLLGICIRCLFEKEEVNPNIAFSFDEGLTISEMVMHDFGIAVLANTSLLQNPDLSVIPLDAKSDYATLCLTYSKNVNHPNYVSNFIRHLIANSKII